MPAPRKPDKSGDRERDRDESGDEGYGVRVAAGTRPHGRGREREVFLDYVTRRWEGSPPPSAEAYAQAERLWRQLPGAVITLPTDLGEPPEQPPPGMATGAARGQES